MLSLIKPKQKSILGIDLSSASVKILQLSINGAGTRCIEGYSTLLLPDNAMEGNVVKDIDAVADTIKKVVSMASLTTKQAALAVPDASAISKVIQISEGMSESEIEELVIIEADKYIPYPIDEINIDFNVLGPSSKNSAMQDVLIVASRAENVNTRVEAVHRAGLEAVIVDVESYVVERAAQLLKPDFPALGENKVIAIIDIGAVYSHLFVLQNMKIIYSRDEEFGGSHLIASIIQQYGISAQEALAGVQQGTLPPDYRTRLLNPFNDRIFLQVKRSLQFFFSTSQYSFVDHIVLAGGVARQPGIAERLQAHIGVPITIANPLASMSFSKTLDAAQVATESPSLIIACGLALRNIE